MLVCRAGVSQGASGESASAKDGVHFPSMLKKIKGVACRSAVFLNQERFVVLDLCRVEADLESFALKLGGFTVRALAKIYVLETTSAVWIAPSPLHSTGSGRISRSNFPFNNSIVLGETWTRPGCEVDSIRLAVFTVLPQRS